MGLTVQRVRGALLSILTFGLGLTILVLGSAQQTASAQTTSQQACKDHNVGHTRPGQLSDKRSCTLWQSNAGGTPASDLPIAGPKIGQVTIKTYVPTAAALYQDGTPITDNNGTLGYAKVKATVDVKLPRGNYVLHLVELYRDGNGVIVGSSGTLKPFRVKHDNCRTKVSASLTFFTGDHSAEVFITPGSSATSVASGRALVIRAPYFQLNASA